MKFDVFSEARDCDLWWAVKDGLQPTNAVYHAKYRTVESCRNACIVEIQDCVAVEIQRNGRSRIQCYIHVDSSKDTTTRNKDEDADDANLFILQKNCRRNGGES